MSTIRFGDGTVRIRRGDLCWLFNRTLANRYTCPILMTLSMWLWRLRGKRVHWYENKPGDRVFFGYAPKAPDQGFLVEAPALFPHWVIRAECNFWNWLRQRRTVRRHSRRNDR